MLAARKESMSYPCNNANVSSPGLMQQPYGPQYPAIRYLLPYCSAYLKVHIPPVAGVATSAPAPAATEIFPRSRTGGKAEHASSP